MDNMKKSDNTAEVLIGNKLVGDGHPCYIIAEIGINHNGDIDLARRLISVAVAAGCDAVKFQKRTVEVVYTPEELAKPRESPFGTTNGDLKHGLEFGHDEYRLIDRYCREVKMPWFASCWDEKSVDFIDQFDPPCYKIASASLTDDNLLRHTRSKGKPIILSTGMSTIEEIDHAVEVLGTEDLILLHACSVYPAHYPELNLQRDHHAARALRGSGGLLRPRNRPALHRGRGGPGRLLHRTPHHARPRDVGLRPGRLARAQRHHQDRQLRPHRGAVAGRWRQARLEREQPIIKKLRRVGAAA